MINSKRKGNKFERTVAKWMSDWTGYKFGRTPYSGANHQSRDLASDVMCTDERHAHRCKISVECKCYKDIKFEHILLGTKGSEVEKFWNQATNDALRSAKVPILIMRYNSMPSNEFFMAVGEDLAKEFIPFVKDTRYMVFNIGNELNLYIFMASAVLNKVSYKRVHKLAKTIVKNR